MVANILAVLGIAASFFIVLSFILGLGLFIRILMEDDE